MLKLFHPDGAGSRRHALPCSIGPAFHSHQLPRRGVSQSNVSSGHACRSGRPKSNRITSAAVVGRHSAILKNIRGFSGKISKGWVSLKTVCRAVDGVPHIEFPAAGINVQPPVAGQNAVQNGNRAASIINRSAGRSVSGNRDVYQRECAVLRIVKRTESGAGIAVQRGIDHGDPTAGITADRAPRMTCLVSISLQKRILNCQGTCPLDKNGSPAAGGIGAPHSGVSVIGGIVFPDAFAEDGLGRVGNVKRTAVTG